MKTPRDLLLDRHANIRSRLGALRHQVVAEHVGAALAEPAARPGTLARLWTELFWSCRRPWLGLASAWALIAMFNLAPGPDAPLAAGRGSRTPPTAETRHALAEQARLRAELLERPSRSPAPARPSRVPGPRSGAVAAPAVA
jgi:hypothetical protein